MDTKEFFLALRALAVKEDLPLSEVCESLERALVTAIKGDYRNKDIVHCHIDPASGSFRIFVRKNVVSEIEDRDTDLTVDEAKRYNPSALPGDVIEMDLDPAMVSRISAEKGKHVLRSAIRDAENAKKLKELQSHIQELIDVKVRKVDEDGSAVVEFGKVIASLPASEQLPDDHLAPGDFVKVYVADIKEGSGSSPKPTFSRTHPDFVKRLLEKEVPEILDGVVEVKSVSREAGSRSKIAVFSSDKDIDPVGACIGQGSKRVNAIVGLLGGEKLDIVRYSDNPADFVAAALAPADVISVDIDENEEKVCRVTVPDSQLSLAIGNKGQNVRLAVKLTGWKIDIKSESDTGDAPAQDEAQEEAPAEPAVEEAPAEE